MDYKCTNSFTSSNGKRFIYGEKISSYYFLALTRNEQRNFVRCDDDDDDRPLFSGSSIFDTSDSSSSDSSSSDSSSDFGGFGDGDSGGGGASGDW